MGTEIGVRDLLVYRATRPLIRLCPPRTQVVLGLCGGRRSAKGQERTRDYEVESPLRDARGFACPPEASDRKRSELDDLGAAKRNAS